VTANEPKENLDLPPTDEIPMEEEKNTSTTTDKESTEQLAHESIEVLKNWIGTTLSIKL